jgi:hypothetical protein
LCGSENRQGQERALRLRIYMLCSECARLIDLAEDNRQQREVESADLIRHETEQHAFWLEVLGIEERDAEVSRPSPAPAASAPAATNGTSIPRFTAPA